MRHSALLLVSAAAFALLGTAALADPNPIIKSNNQIALDFNDVSFGYVETSIGRFDSTPGKLDTESGGVPGVSINASLMQDWLVENFYASAQFTYNEGQTHYVGSTGGKPFGSSVGPHDAVVHDFDFRVGEGFVADDDLMLTPYIGAGAHNWGRKVNAGEDYDNGYVGLGLLAQYAPTDRLVLSGSVLGGGTFGSSIDVRGKTGFSGDLGDSGTVRVGLAADYALTDMIHVNAGVDYAYWRYGESAVFHNGGANEGEPGSRTANLTFKVGAGIAL